MASGPITSWQIDGETVETVADFILGGSKITEDGDCNHEKTLTPWKESYDQPRQHIKKQRHYFADKVPSSQSHGFSSSHVWMWQFGHKESWALENWCFWTVVLENALVSPLDLQGDQTSQTLKEISSEYSLEGLMLKLKLQYFGHLMQRTDSLEKTLMLGKIEGRRKRGQQRMRWLDGITPWWTWVWASFGSWWWTERLGVLQSMGSQGVRHEWVTELNRLNTNTSQTKSKRGESTSQLLYELSIIQTKILKEKETTD